MPTCPSLLFLHKLDVYINGENIFLVSYIFFYKYQLVVKTFFVRIK